MVQVCWSNWFLVHFWKWREGLGNDVAIVVPGSLPSHTPSMRNERYEIRLPLQYITSFGDRVHVSEGGGRLLAKDSGRSQHERKLRTA